MKHRKRLHRKQPFDVEATMAEIGDDLSIAGELQRHEVPSGFDLAPIEDGQFADRASETNGDGRTALDQLVDNSQLYFIQ